MERNRRVVHSFTGLAVACVWLSTAYVDVDHYALAAYAVIMLGTAARVVHPMREGRRNRRARQERP